MKKLEKSAKNGNIFLRSKSYMVIMVERFDLKVSK